MNSVEVKKIREDMGLNQEEFAAKIGVDRRTIINWEKGKKIPETKVKRLNLLLDEKKSVSTAITTLEKIDNKTDSQSLDNLSREILDLKDHIKTLKDFLNEKSKLADIYIIQNTLLKEKLARYEDDETVK